MRLPRWGGAPFHSEPEVLSEAALAWLLIEP